MWSIHIPLTDFHKQPFLTHEPHNFTWGCCGSISKFSKAQDLHKQLEELGKQDGMCPAHSRECLCLFGWGKSSRAEGLQSRFSRQEPGTVGLRRMLGSGDSTDWKLWQLTEMVTEIMALESRWKQEGKHTEHSVTSFSGKCPQALGPRVLYNWKQKGLQEIPLLMMSPWETKGWALNWLHGCSQIGRHL